MRKYVPFALPTGSMALARLLSDGRLTLITIFCSRENGEGETKIDQMQNLEAIRRVSIEANRVAS